MLFRSLAVHIELQCEGQQLLEQQLRPELKRNLLLIVKEALNNIQKHAQASELRFICQFMPNTVHVLIRDNGVGFIKSPGFNQGNGMKNMQKRAADLGGSLDIAFDAGTVLRLQFPWNQ